MNFDKLALLACLALCLSLSLADEDSRDTSELDLLLIDAEDSEEADIHKRNSGYVYARPSRLRFTRPRQRVRPFKTYGPPTSSGFRPASPQQSRHRYPGRIPALEDIQFGSQGHRQTGSVQQEVPSPIRDYDFKEPSPIASQNNMPFNPHFANYLPPKNQRLPGYTPPHTFQQQQPTHLPDDQRLLQSLRLPQNLTQPGTSQISDATYFLMQNAQALSQLYNSPATNLNYPPFDENPDSQNQLDLKSFDELNQQRAFASDELAAIQSQEKDQLIRQLQLSLAQSDLQSTLPPITLNAEKPDHQKLLFDNQKLDLQYSLTNVPSAAPLSYGISSAPTTPTPPALLPQGGAGTNVGTLLPTLPAAPALPYPQYGGFVPLLVGPNFGSHYGATVGGAAGSSPTHFGIPLPGDKPTAAPPVVGGPKPQPVPSVPLQPAHPVAATPVQPIFPIVPQPAVNPILLKPVKPVYPLYYYTGTGYRLQKPLVYPWSYAPSYGQVRPGIWK